jgi:hypothetical protein
MAGSSFAGQSSSTVAAEVLIGPEGGDLLVDKPGTPLHGFSVHVPPEALDRITKVTLLHEAPRDIVVRMGEPVGLFVGLKAEGVDQFRRAVDIRCLYDAGRWKGRSPLGFAINEHNQLNLIDKVGGSTEAGDVIFATFIPLTFTWLFIAPVSLP